MGRTPQNVVAFPGNAAESNPKEKGDRQMEAKPAQQNIQDTFLNTARKERHSITIYLVSGVKLTGRIRSFDKYSVVLETSNQEQLIFKHAISTVVISRATHSHLDSRPTPVNSHTETAMPNAASGTEG
jgi:host factor-I protein